MRQIEKTLIEAVRNRKTWKQANTRTWQSDKDTTAIFLHENPIALYAHDQKTLYVQLDTLARWKTRTTCSRLRALGVPVNIKNNQPLIDGQPLHELDNGSGVYAMPAQF